MKTRHSFKILGSLIVLVISCLAACKKLNIVTTTAKSQNIYSYLTSNPDQFSEFVKMLDKTGYRDFLKAYGTYTCFAPDNNAVLSYLKETGKASIDAFTDDELKNIVKLHLIQDTVKTVSFTDGKLSQVTMLGQYLITGVSNANGVSTYTINRQSLVTQPNIYLSNGYIHVIDHVLKPATKTVAQLIEANPNFSIFTQALKETGYYDSLNIVNNPDTTRRFLTVIAETNKALQDSGINSYAALKAKYSKTGDPRRADDSLHLYVAYHIIFDAKYIADIVSAQSQTTLAPLNVLLTKLDDQTILINDLDFNGVHEKGIVIERASSDVTATNGVAHTALAHFTIKNRLPVRVDWDVADQPELRKLTSIFRKLTAVPNSPGGYGPFPLGFFKDITWQPGASQGISYGCTGPTNTSWYQWWGDVMIMPMSTTATNARA
ncbi:fasciclin domain-containing protein, partial [Daejeonella sp.]|uniref:fasciclin domain-containing protein n=1 Tax=Daejeonella sp. TaxID=2805397 RepID=UPI0030BD0B27